MLNLEGLWKSEAFNYGSRGGFSKTAKATCDKVVENDVGMLLLEEILDFS